MMINVFGMWLVVASISYLKPLDKGCEIVTDEPRTQYTSGMECEELGIEINRQIERERGKERLHITGYQEVR